MEIALATYGVPISVLVPLLIGIYRYNYLDSALKFSFYYLVFSSLINLVGIVMAEYRIPNLGLLHFYTAFEFVMLCLYFRFLPERVVPRLLVDCLIPLFLVLCLVNVLFFEKSNMHNAYTRSIEAIVIIAFCLRYFNAQIKLTHALSWKNNPFNWLNTALLLYFTSSFALFISANLLAVKTSIQTQLSLWAFHNVVSIIMYQLFAVGYYKCKR